VEAEKSIEKAAAAASGLEIRRTIGRKLRAHCGPTEPVPDQLMEVLKPSFLRIDECESERGRDMTSNSTAKANEKEEF